ncbi:MAG: ABC transporter ATP-binding protein [Myxococcales bacterium]|nr:ABC transporter ATP-binding protein [Myxococcales bacterium]
MAVIEVHQVHRRYGDVHALRGVSLSVDRTEVVGLLGPNGAGKTTLLKILTGVLAPTSGRVTLGGHDALTDPLACQRALGWLPEAAPLYDEMSVGAFLRFVGRARGLGAAETALAVARSAEATAITERLDHRIATLSRGYRQRVGLAQALLHQPQILVLDEPTTGLDPNQVVEIRRLIREVGRTRTVLLSTHVLSEVEATCDRVLVLNDGQLVADDATDRVTAAASGTTCVVGLGPSKVRADASALIAEIRSLDHVTDASVVAAVPPEVHRFEVQATSDVRGTLFRWAVASGHVIVELSHTRQSLEEVFRTLTEQA